MTLPISYISLVFIIRHFHLVINHVICFIGIFYYFIALFYFISFSLIFLIFPIKLKRKLYKNTPLEMQKGWILINKVREADQRQRSGGGWVVMEISGLRAKTIMF